MIIFQLLSKQNTFALFSIIATCCLSTNLFAQVSFGKPEKINKGWQFNLGDVPGTNGAQAIAYDASNWRKVDLPHDYSVEGWLSPHNSSGTGYLPGGIGWYRKTLNIPQGKPGDKVFIYFEGIYEFSEVFVNGWSVGKRPNGYVSFMYDITPFVEAGKPALIAVRVDNRDIDDSRYYTGSGIYRNVWLITSGPVHIAQWGVFYHTKSADIGHAVLTVDIKLENGSDTKANLTVRQQLLDAGGKEVATSSANISVPAKAYGKTTVDLTVNNPLLWSIKTPNLYKLKTTVLQNGQIIDETITTAGIRTFTFDSNKGFALNGEWMKMKGVCIHHDAGVLGASVPREVWERRLKILKEMGVNAIRLAHNPQAPDLFELCDELGLLMKDEMYDEWELPKNKWVQGRNVGNPGHNGTSLFFNEWYSRDLADMVRRNRNHVCVFAYSIGNEIDYPNDPYTHEALEGSSNPQARYVGFQPIRPHGNRMGDIAKRLTALVHENDPTRPVTAALAGVVMSNATEYPSALDIVGYNYTEDRYEIDHNTYPQRVIYGSENGQGMAQWKAVRDNEFIFGQFLWTGIDFLGESGRWPTRGSQSGILDLCGFAKPLAYFRQALWVDKPVAYVGTSPFYAAVTGQSSRGPSINAQPIWNYNDDETVRVSCYTNAAKARLLLNEREVGASKDYDDSTGIIFWDIPYAAGTLEVEGMDAAGNKICGSAIRTSGKPSALTATIDANSISSGEGLAQIIIQVVDENGIPVFLADNEVTCTIEGPAKLLGLEASNGADMSDYRDNKHRVFRGRMLAYIQATGETGGISVIFSSPWLTSVEVKL